MLDSVIKNSSIVIDWIIQNILNNSTFLSSVFGAGFGAGLAFYLNSRRDEKQNIEKNMSYLIYSISVLSKLTSTLYEYKISFIKPREPDLEYIGNFIKQYSSDYLDESNQHKIQYPFNQIFLIIQDKGLFLPLDIDKLSFLAKLNPNLISMLIALEQSLKTSNFILDELNKIISESKKRHNVFDISYFDRVYSSTDNFSKNIDDGLYFSETLSELFVEFGKREYKEKFYIQGLSSEEQFKDLKPKPIECWKFIKKWPKQKSFVEKNLPTFKKIVLWLVACKESILEFCTSRQINTHKDI